jgi:ubiquitin-conjugating enzyme E2 T
MAARLARIKKEVDMLATDPGPGISAWLVDDDNMLQLQGQIAGPADSPYEGGLFSLSIDLPERYPMEPPRVRFLTPIYHPNIDSDGRICLDTLKMAPHGSWSPSVNINTLLLTIRLLMAQPNAEDGLVPEITEEYKRDAALWRKKVRNFRHFLCDWEEGLTESLLFAFD